MQPRGAHHCLYLLLQLPHSSPPPLTRPFHVRTSLRRAALLDRPFANALAPSGCKGTAWGTHSEALAPSPLGDGLHQFQYTYAAMLHLAPGE